MKTILYYFSGTGNSLQAAKDISLELGETELISVTEALGRKNLPEAERMGIIFPVYCWGIPRIIRELVDRFQPGNTGYTFAVCTCGGIPGGTLEKMAEHFQSKGMRLNAGFALKMPGNCVTLYGAFPEEKQKILFEKAKDKIRKIVSLIKKNKEAPVEKNSFIVNWLLGLVYKASYSHFPSQDKHYWVDERCNACGICEQVCPRNNIKMENRKPAWLHHCEQCVACIQWCPLEAIQFKKGTLTRKRYHHPEIKLQEIISKLSKQGQS